MLKKTLSITVLLLIISAFSNTANAADPCEQVLCLSGVMNGAGVVKGCSSPVSDYFNIIEMKHGSFLPDHTSKKRKKQLDKCSSAGNGVIEKINNKFGRLRSL